MNEESDEEVAVCGYWKPKPHTQRAKLAPRQSGWNLAGAASGTLTTRTRHGGNGRPNLQRKVVIEMIDESDSSEGEKEEEEVAVEEEEEEAPIVVVARKKPPATRAIVEVAQLTAAFAKFSVCPECHGSMDMAMKTICLASSITLKCCDEDCGFVYYGDPLAKAGHRENARDNRERSTYYAINVLYVLGFLSVGDGCKEAARLLGLLGLPNDTTMESRSFTIIEGRIGLAIRNLTKTILQENLTQEVKLTLQNDEEAFLLWNDHVNPTVPKALLPLRAEDKPMIGASFDMAWQQKGSGQRYDSPSGHGLMIGRLTRKPIALCVKSKLCNECDVFNRMNKDGDVGAAIHEDCPKNHFGSSGSMEPQACLDLVVELYDRFHCGLALLCCDDDSSVRSLCKWSNADYLINNNTDVLPRVPITKGANKGKLQQRIDKGKLPANVPEPKFVADPNHRRKLLTGELYNLAKQRMELKATMTRMDAARIGKNFGYMSRSLFQLPDTSEYTIRAAACLEHHFDDHMHCGDWCRRKALTAEQKETSLGYYRCKQKDAKLYAMLNEKVSRFIELDRLVEIAHGMDTNMNESFNNSATWFAPKNKVYCASHSLQTRLSLAVGINSIGLQAYFERVFETLGIEVTPNVLHFLKQKEGLRKFRLDKIRTKAAKKKRNKRKYDKLADDTKIAAKERAKRDGTYKSGTNMQEEEEDEQPDAQNTKTKRKSYARSICPFCGKKGHTTKKSKHCTAAANNGTNIAAVDILHPLLAAAAYNPEDTGLDADRDAADDVEAYDSFPLDDDDDASFYDCGTFDADSDIEDVGVIRAVL
jgi:hypothetical protein